MSRPIVSICIPTYNMGKYLVKLVESINNQCIRIQDAVEICISDNASTDETEALVKSLQSKYKNIVYHRNDENIGADRNFLKVVEIASGEYCWLMGADDVVIENIIEKILTTLKEQKDIAIFLGDRINCSVNDAILGKEYWSSRKRIVTKDMLADYILNAFSIGAVFSFISTIIVQKKEWDLSAERLNIEEFIGTAYIHSLILLNILKENGKLLYLHYPIVYARRDNDSFLEQGYLNRITIDYNYMTIIEKLFGKNSNEYASMKILLKKERNIFHFLKAKASEEKVDNMINFMKQHEIKGVFLVKYLPKALIQTMLIVYQAINFKRYRK